MSRLDPITTPAASLTACWDGTSECVPRARQAARDHLRAVAPRVADETADAVNIVVSELVTNAVRHAGGKFTLRLSPRGNSIEVAVTDNSAALPRMRRPDFNDGKGGFGLPLVRQLSRCLTVTPRPRGGKTVTAVVDRVAS
ncbi:ATP-binding protein [Streptomyces sp. NPDC000229]|uniref:ATP-binding protein n=1 Tax=Streptomyces sp. NPDC000229 TaxID=3154247 RepID=UPI0033171132